MRNNIKENGDLQYEARLKISKKAFEEGCVIRSSVTRTFYTPREFLDSDEKVEIKIYGMQEYSDFTLHYPANAINFKMEELAKSNQQFQDFMKKMLNAFELSPLDKKKKHT